MPCPPLPRPRLAQSPKPTAAPKAICLCKRVPPSLAPAPTHTEPKAECPPEQRLSVLRAVRQGLVCSFGSVCIAGAILMLLQAVNQVLSWVQQASQVRVHPHRCTSTNRFNRNNTGLQTRP